MDTAESRMYSLMDVDLTKAIMINSLMKGFSPFCCLARYWVHASCNHCEITHDFFFFFSGCM